jgi:3-hydroxyisobutyrate dehydrogenase-like beta-hydroxyacid dehydrogenase
MSYPVQEAVGLVGLRRMGTPDVLGLADRAARRGVAVVDSPVSGRIPASPFVGYKRAAFLDAESTPVAFTTRLMLKDVELALALAREHGVTTSLTAEAGSGLTRVVSAGHGDADIANVAAALRATHMTERP